MILRNPVCITPRLMAGVRVGDSYVSIAYAGRNWRSGKQNFRYCIDIPGHEHEGTDLEGHGGLQTNLAALLGFLSACGDSYAYSLSTGTPGENTDLFPPQVAEWCYQNLDELSLLSLELEETGELIEE
jgi:hypothetical protein